MKPCPHMPSGEALSAAINAAGMRAGDRRIELAPPGQRALRGPLPGWELARAALLDAAVALDPERPDTIERFHHARLAWVECGAWSDESSRRDCIMHEHRRQGRELAALSCAVHNALPTALQHAVREVAKEHATRLAAEDGREAAAFAERWQRDPRCEFCGAAEDHETPHTEATP